MLSHRLLEYHTLTHRSSLFSQVSIVKLPSGFEPIGDTPHNNTIVERARVLLATRRRDADRHIVYLSSTARTLVLLDEEDARETRVYIINIYCFDSHTSLLPRL